jgi:hypothetical protein
MQDSAASNPICLLQANAHGIGCLHRVEDLRWRSHSGFALPWSDCASLFDRED